MNNRISTWFFASAAGCAIFVAAISAGADERSWTSKFGSRSVQGEFVELKDGRLTLRKLDGSTFALPVSALITEDQEFASNAQKTIDTDNQVDVLAAVEGKMIRMVEGKPMPFELQAQNRPSHILFYVVSSLCDTCLEHAPRLKGYYEKTLAPAPEIELIVISLDSDREQQQEYLAGQRLPFPAVNFEAMTPFSTAITPRIFSSQIDGCQTFILATADGKVLSKSALEPKQAIAEILKE